MEAMEKPKDVFSTAPTALGKLAKEHRVSHSSHSSYYCPHLER
jgi:hypothetical protein